MNAKEPKSQLMPEVRRLERRSKRGEELSSAEIMDILRKRGAKLAGKKSVTLAPELQWDDTNTDRASWRNRG